MCNCVIDSGLGGGTPTFANLALSCSIDLLSLRAADLTLHIPSSFYSYYIFFLTIFRLFLLVKKSLSSVSPLGFHWASLTRISVVIFAIYAYNDAN